MKPQLTQPFPEHDGGRPLSGQGSDPEENRLDFTQLLLGGSGAAEKSRRENADAGGRRQWWRIDRRGSLRYYLPADRRQLRASLNLMPTWTAALGIRLRTFLPRGLGAWPLVGTVADENSLDLLLRELSLGSDLHYAVYVGTPGIFQKYTVKCLDRNGKAVAYLKLSEGQASAEAITNEVHMLERLAADDRFAAHVPRPISLQLRWHRTISALAPFHRVGKRAPAHLGVVLAEFVRRLFALDRIVLPWTESPVRRRLAGGAETLAANGDADGAQRVSRALASLDAGFGNEPLPHGRLHGDLLPWNTLASNPPYVIDWEWSRVGLPLYDVFHYEVFPRIHGIVEPSPRRLAEHVRTPRFRALLQHASGDLPVSPERRDWWLAYLAEAYAFYASSTTAWSASRKFQGLTARWGRLLDFSLGERT